MLQSNIPIIVALFLGILASISPCTLGTNITAIAYIAQKSENKKYVFMAGVLYTIGRMTAYSLIGFLIILAGINIEPMADFLQNIGEMFLGPLFIVIGLVLLDAINISFNKERESFFQKIYKKISSWKYIGAFFLGFLFALAFCPYSAVLFFGGLIPLSLKSVGGITFPAIFAIGTGLPVLFFTILIAIGVSWLNRAINKMKIIEKFLRYIIATTFIIVGLYYIFLIFS